MSEPAPEPAQDRDRWQPSKNPLKEWLNTRRRLTKAAGISSATVTCHSDTWNFIQEKLWDRTRYQLPASKEPGLVEARISGVDVVTILSVMRRMSMPWSDEFSRHRAIARRVYAAIALVVDQIDPDAKVGSPVPPIVIDAKIREA